MHEIEVKRRLDEAELASVTELLAAATEADAHPAIDEHTWLDLVQGGRAGFAGLIAWKEGHPHPVGYAQLSLGHGPGDANELQHWALEVVVDPHHRVPGNSIALDLVSGAIEIIRAEGGGHLHLWVSRPSPAHDRLASAVGLSAGRALYQMTRPLPLDEHAAIETRPFEVGRDEEEWLEVNNRAFAWHPEQGGWSMRTLKERQAQAWFDPAGFLLHYVGDRLAGFCWTKVHRTTHGDMGEIYVVAVDPDFAGKGLGRQLTLAGLDYLVDKGLSEAMLYVDAANKRAVAMYVDLGFVVNHIDRAYTGDIAPRSQHP